MQNDVWNVVPRPEGKSVMTSKWIYKIKHATDGSIKKYKAQFMARGFSQKEGINYEETFAPMGRYTSIMALATKLEWKIHQMEESFVRVKASSQNLVWQDLTTS